METAIWIIGIGLLAVCLFFMKQFEEVGNDFEEVYKENEALTERLAKIEVNFFEYQMDKRKREFEAKKQLMIKTYNEADIHLKKVHLTKWKEQFLINRLFSTDETKEMLDLLINLGKNDETQL